MVLCRTDGSLPSSRSLPKSGSLQRTTSSPGGSVSALPRRTLYSMPVQPLLQSSMPVPQAIARVLEQAGIEFVFGMPGGRTGPIFDALFDHADRIRAVLVREEGLAAVMADVYARLTGKPGVAMGQSA